MRFLSAFLLFALVLLPAASARAQEVSAHASFNPSAATLGETVQFRVDVINGEAEGGLPQINVDGLDFRYMGNQKRHDVSFNNGQVRNTNTISHIFQVTPRQAGTFTVPALRIPVGGRVVTTEPVSLAVQAGGAGGGSGTVDRAGRAEIVVSKKTLYVGETVPVELRLYVDSQLRWELESMPTLEADGFTKAKPAGASQTGSVVRDGRSYAAVTVQTAITPTKAGRLSIGPAVFPYRAQIPRAARRRPSQFGGGLFDDLFNDPVFGRVEQLSGVSEKVEIEVKPVPLAGRPASFGGAVGHFSLAAEGSPARVKVGDPITMTLRVSGSGSFDRVTAPAIAETTGWRTYPPSTSFKADDQLETRGTKTFEVAVIPETKKDHMPLFEFSYFDPDSQKYVTLRTNSAALQVEGDAVPVPRNPERAPVVASATPAPAAAAPKPTDIIGIRYDFGQTAGAKPLYTQHAFLLGQLAPLSLLVGLVGVRFWPSGSSTRRGQALRRERDRHLARLKSAGSRREFFDEAARALQLEGALRFGRAAETIDARDLLRLPGLSTEAAATIQEVFNAQAEALYAGTGAGAAEVRLEPGERERVRDVLQPLLKSS